MKNLSKIGLLSSVLLTDVFADPGDKRSYVPVDPITQEAWADYTQEKVGKVLKNEKYKGVLSAEEREKLEVYLEGFYGQVFSFCPEANIGDIIAEVIEKTGDARFRIKSSESPEVERPIEGYPKECIKEVNDCLSYILDPKYPETIIFVINRFRSGKIAESLRDIVGEHKDKKVIFDMTENRGGSSSEKRKLIEIFLEEGVVAHFEKKGVVRAIDDEGEKEEIDLEYPIVVFISEKTASSAETFIDPLLKTGHVVTCGSQTFGKWSKNIEMDDVLDGYTVKVTIDRHKGKKELEGLSPQIPFDLSGNGKQKFLARLQKGDILFREEK